MSDELTKKICAKIAFYENVGVGEWMTCSREIIALVRQHDHAKLREAVENNTMKFNNFYHGTLMPTMFVDDALKAIDDYYGVK